MQLDTEAPYTCRVWQEALDMGAASVGWLLGIGILTTVGVILIVVGVVLFAIGAAGHAVGGRSHWY